MHRALVLLTVLILASVVFVTLRTSEQVSSAPDGKSSAPEKTHVVRREQGRTGAAETARAATTLSRSPEKTPCPGKESGMDNTKQEQQTAEEGTRIGNFTRPENVPQYEILDDRRVSRDCDHAAQLLVDTTSRSQKDYELISRDIKARYNEYDAVSVEFLDTNGLAEYHGSALIFNTPAGSSYLGYVYGPINTRGYYVSAAD